MVPRLMVITLSAVVPNVTDRLHVLQKRIASFFFANG